MHHTFYYFMVTFYVVGHLQNKLVPIITYMNTSKNNCSLTSLSVFPSLETNILIKTSLSCYPVTGRLKVFCLLLTLLTKKW